MAGICCVAAGRTASDRSVHPGRPIGIAGGLNLYGYANGDPINLWDPFGLDPMDRDTLVQRLSTATGRTPEEVLEALQSSDGLTLDEGQTVQVGEFVLKAKDKNQVRLSGSDGTLTASGFEMRFNGSGFTITGARFEFGGPGDPTVLHLEGRAGPFGAIGVNGRVAWQNGIDNLPTICQVFARGKNRCP